MLDPPRRKDLTPSDSRAAWFGVSLGAGGRVTELKLVDNGLVGILPNALGGLEMLRYLHLGRNTLSGTIPSGLSSLGALEWLNLSENVLTGPVPGSLSSLSRLVELNLSANRLTGPLPPELCGMASLVCLQLSKNDLDGFLPAEISELTSLVTLCLDHNRFCGPIPRGVAGMKALKELRLDHNVLTGSDVLSFVLAVIFIVVPTSVVVASTMSGARERDRNKKILLTVLQLRLVWEARDGLKKRRETRDYKTAKFVEACFEAAPQMLLQTVAVVSLWNDKETDNSDVFVAFSIMNSVFSVSWETMSALDRGWAEEMVEERARQGTSWPCGASAHRWLMLLSLWVFHVCEASVGLRGLSLSMLALTLRGWSALVMAGVWGARVAIAKATEASDLKTTKVLIKALAACLLDSIWDSKSAYIAASVCTLLESSTFFVVATLEMRGENTPLEETLSEVAWVAGSVYALRFVLDLWLRAPLHWGTLIDVEDLPFGWREGISRLRGALFGRRSPTATTMPAEPPPLATTPQATPLSPRRAGF
ncbi:unnamed protein product [Ectocarpus fasciculatus]